MSQKRTSHWWETVAIFAAIVSLWPRILGWPHPFWSVLLYVMLALMLLVGVLRLRRLWRLKRGSDGDENP